MSKIESVLVACRGVGAYCVIRSLKQLGIRTVAIHSEADRSALHALSADRAICVGNAPLAVCYTQAEVILDAARVSGVDAIHPGYGALSTNSNFAEAVERLGLRFIGPNHEMMRAFSSAAGFSRFARDEPLLLLVERQSMQGGASCCPVDIHIFGDGRGSVVSLGETTLVQLPGDFTMTQSPPDGVRAETLAALRRAVTAFARDLHYRAAGSLTLIVDETRGVFSVGDARPGLSEAFRLHEALHGIDLVEWSLRAVEGTAAKLQLPAAAAQYGLSAQVTAGHAAQDSSPRSGIITGLKISEACRVDSGIELGTELTSDGELHLMTLVATGSTRTEVVEALAAALRATDITGIETNLDNLRSALGLALEGTHEKGNLPAPPRVEVLRPGTFTIVVDYPGRLGYWPVGIPPSGPMDDLSHRYANRIVGNTADAATLEMTLAGPTLRFASDAVVAFVGAAMPALLDDIEVAANRAIAVRAGQILKFGAIADAGSRTYLAVRGGIHVAPYLNSSTTFTLGGFGGHNGRALRPGDSLRFGDSVAGALPLEPIAGALIELTNHWNIGVLYGPHAAPEFFTHSDIRVLFSAEYEVHFNSNRTGVRLIGPKPDWARADGGEAGLHPSNIHDVAYAIGAIDFTGDMPILLGPDGPSLGGFVCPATVVSAELWKLGQLRPGDRVRFVPISEAQAVDLRQTQERAIQHLLGARAKLIATQPGSAIIARTEATETRVSVTYRRSGDQCLLVEYGPMELDLRLRFRVHALMQWLNARQLPSIIELTPGIRSLQIHFDDTAMARKRLLDELERAESELPNADALEVPSRIVHLPLSWDDPQTRLAIQKYSQSVRSDAPWCPSNIEFIRRINGLADEKDVYDIVFGANYLVLGLGDVYLGAPVATPIDPRHRLVTTKYNPARTWTPENAVGIGGAYLCIYGMEGPGGYQFVGRTIQMYNRYRRTQRFTEGQPWLLRFFDQLRFYPVSAEALLDHRRDFLTGKFDVKIEDTRFRLADYQQFLATNAASIRQFKSKQQAAFDAERQRWVDNGQLAPSAPRKRVEGEGRDPQLAPGFIECTR